MANMRISDIPAAASLHDGDIFEIAQVDSGSTSGYMSFRTTMILIANYVAKLAQYTSDLQTTDKTVIGAINELKRLIALIPGFNIVKVNSLPTEDIDTHTLYLVPSQDPEAQNSCDEYINTDGTTAGWELVGSTNIDLSDYYTKLEVDGLLADKLEADDFEANQTASANPITLETKQAGLAKSCVVSFGPIQDLHGQSAPYPAGGGKNKFNDTIGTHTINANTDATRIIGDVYLEANETYTISCKQTPSPLASITRNILLMFGGGSTTYNPVGNDTTIKPMVFTPTVSGTYSIRVWGHTLSADTIYSDFQVEVGTQATPFAPYENICPISGRTEASVKRIGANQWDEVTQLGYLDGGTGTVYPSYTDRLCSKNFCECIGNHDYYCKNGHSSGLTIVWYDKNQVYIRQNSFNNNVLTSPANAKYYKLGFPSNYGTTYNNNVSLNYIPTDTVYHAYTAETHTHQYSETIYGGVDDFVNGGATSNYGKIVFDGTEGWVSSVGRYQLRLNGVMKSGSYYNDDNVLCSAYPKSATLDVNNTVVVGYNSDYIYFYATEDFPTLNDWRTRLQQGDIELTYLKATPTTVQLSPEAVTLLAGMNVISTDGDKVQVEFSDIPVGDYSVLLGYIKSLEARIQTLEGGGNRTLALTKNILQEEKNDIIKEEPEELELEKGQEEEKEETMEEKTDEEPEHSAESK